MSHVAPPVASGHHTSEGRQGIKDHAPPDQRNLPKGKLDCFTTTESKVCAEEGVRKEEPKPVPHCTVCHPASEEQSCHRLC